MPKKKKVRTLPPAVRIEVRKAYDLVAPLRRKRTLTPDDLVELQDMGTRLQALKPFDSRKAEARVLQTLGGMELSPALSQNSETYVGVNGPKVLMHLSLRVTPLEEDLT